MGTHLRAGSDLTPLSVQACAVSTERATAGSLRQVIGLYVVAFGAECVVVANGFAGASRVPRIDLGHVALSSENVYCSRSKKLGLAGGHKIDHPQDITTGCIRIVCQDRLPDVALSVKAAR